MRKLFAIVPMFALALGLIQAPTEASAAPSQTMRQRVLANIAASKRARQSSGFARFAAAERNGFRNLKRPKAPQRVRLNGPNPVPNNYVIYGGGSQPDTLINKNNKWIKRQIRAKAGKLRMNKKMKAWDKIDYLQKVIRQKVKHAGNELDVTKNPNKYTKYNHKKKSTYALARLGDYLNMHSVVCREFAFLTQVALQDAGFQSRLVMGTIKKNGKVVGGHAWNEVKLNGKWQMVDTTNPQFNKTSPKVAADKGTKNGWVWTPSPFSFRMVPLEKDHRGRRQQY